MTNWETLIAESVRLEDVASKIQEDEKVGLSQEAINALSNEYYTWLSQSLSVLPQDLKDKFRSEYEGTFWSAKIKKFLELPTQLSPFRPNDEKSKELFSYWTYPYKQNFYPCIRSQRQLLIEARERERIEGSANLQKEGKWNETIRNIFKVFIEKADKASTNHEKKLTYEYLAIFLIGSVDGLTIIGHDKQGVSEEIDLWVANESKETFWQRIPGAFIVECKNWGNPVGVPEIRTLTGIMNDKKIPFAILLAKNGVTGDRSHDAGDSIRNNFRDGKYIIVLTQADLLQISNGMHPTDKIKEKYFELIMCS